MNLNLLAENLMWGDGRLLNDLTEAAHLLRCPVAHETPPGAVVDIHLLSWRTTEEVVPKDAKLGRGMFLCPVHLEKLHAVGETVAG